jgi:hypothetical protein
MGLAVVVLCLYLVMLSALLRFERPWANPMWFLLWYYAFNYPVRAILIQAYPDAFNVQSFTSAEIETALEYSTLYVLTFVGAYWLVLSRVGIRFKY